MCPTACTGGVWGPSPIYRSVAWGVRRRRDCYFGFPSWECRSSVLELVASHVRTSRLAAVAGSRRPESLSSQLGAADPPGVNGWRCLVPGTIRHGIGFRFQRLSPSSSTALAYFALHTHLRQCTRRHLRSHRGTHPQILYLASHPFEQG